MPISNPAKGHKSETFKIIFFENNCPKQTAVKPTKTGEYWIKIFFGVLLKIKKSTKLKENESIENNRTILFSELLGQTHNRAILPKEAFSVKHNFPL